MSSAIMRSRRLRTLAAAALLSVAAACSSSTETSDNGSITLQIVPTSATVQQGGSTQVTGTLTRASFAGIVTITVEGAPAGVTGTVTTAPGTGNSAGITLNVASTTTVGSYPLTVRASGSGITSVTKTFTLNVVAPSNSSFTVALNPTSLSLAQGGSISTTLSFTRTSFTDAITLTAENLPTGVTAAFNPASVTGTTSTLTLTATGTAAVGTYNVLLRATATGLNDVTAPLPLTITAAASGSFTIALGASTLPLTLSGTANTFVKATRTGGFAGTITYNVTGVPAGLTATVTSTTVPDSMVVTLTGAAGLVVGTFPLVVHATATGVTEQTANLSAVVSASSGNITLDYSQCSAQNKPLWVAVQDGNGAWTRVTGTGDVYTFANIASSKGGIAVATQSGTNFTTSVTYLAQSEFAARTAGCAATGTVKTVNGTVAGLSANDRANMSLGGALAVVINPTTAFTLNGVAAGNQDLVGWRRNLVTPGATDRGLLRRDQNIAANGSLAVADFTSGESFTPATANLTVAGGGAGDLLTPIVSYLTGATCSNAQLYVGTPAAPTTFTAYGVPAGPQRATDFHSVTVQDQVSATSFRSTTVNFHTWGDRTITLGAALGASTVTVLTGTYKRLQVVVTAPAEYSTGVLTYTDPAGNSFSVSQTAAYAGGQAMTIAVPDLSAVNGYTLSWAPLTGSAVTYSVVAFATTIPSTACAEGVTTKLATLTGTM